MHNKKKAYKLNAALRKRKSRAKKNEDDVVNNDDSIISISNSAYSKPQALGKAIKKAVRALPSSPTKRKAVVHGVANQVGLKLINKVETQLHGNILAEETVNQIKNFYFRSDVVYTMPGMNDEITVYDSGGKVKLRKYYLTMYLREAYSLFKMENDNLEVGFSKFCFLRPPNVLLLHETPADQCKCKIHENFILKLKALKINYSNAWWQSILCDTEQNSLCWQGQCNECKDGRKFPEQVLFGREKPVQWYNWETQLCEERRVLKKVLEEGCVEQLIDLVLEDFGKMRDHTNIKRIQASEFQADQKDKRKRVLQIDFAMSYSAEYQHEVQSALWSRASVTLFTAAVIYDSKCQTYLICSDAPNKDKDTISCFLIHLYEKLEKIKDSIQPEVDVIWSDGPSSEFKNRFMVKLLKVLSAKYSRPFHWKYFATSHGKGIVDGIGGSAKSLVRQRVMSCCDKAIIVQSAQDFANVAAELMPKTQVFYISQAEITEKSISMSLWNEKVPQVKGIKQVHVIECSSEGNIKLLKSARSNN